MRRRIVVKLGTSVLTAGGNALDSDHMAELARQAAALYRSGWELVLCSSGAVAAGRNKLGVSADDGVVGTKQMLAAVGQPRLMVEWERHFAEHGIHVAQILITRDGLQNRQRFLNARDTLQELLRNGIVPVVNENDAVATDEIRVGDNDTLSAFLAVLAEAELLLLLTDQPGLFDSDPRTNPDAVLLPEVRHIDTTLKRAAGGSVSGLGVGGMATKLRAADAARRAGTEVIIASGHARSVILRAARGEAVGTRFPPVRDPLEWRKRWIFAGRMAGGALRVDLGAASALVDGRHSLLPAGITAVEGSFDRGDTVSVVGPDREEVACGVVRYDSRDLRLILGQHSSEIAPRLGYDYGPVAIHRRDLVVVAAGTVEPVEIDADTEGP